MLQELPRELNRKLKRMRDSRDNLKAGSREKMLQNKKLRDRNVEIAQSRDMWRARTQALEKALEEQQEELKRQLRAAQRATEEEKMRADMERKRADLLQATLEDVKKKAKILKL